MKTSNKLLLGLFCLIISSMIVANIMLAKEAKKNNVHFDLKEQIVNDSVNIKINL